MSKQPMKTYAPGKGLVFRYAHIKRDGNYTNLCRNATTGNVHLFTSNPIDITAQLQFMRQFSIFERLPRGVNLIGELWLPGGKAEDIKTAIKDCNPDLQFECFGILHWPSIIAKYHTVDYWELSTCRELVASVGLPWVPHYELTNMLYAAQLMSDIEAGKFPDVEGLVFKNGNLADWHKWKPRKTIDLIIKGFEEGQGKYLNQIGAIVCQTSEGYEVANVSGMSDTQRAYMSQNTDSLIGQVVEVEYQNVGNKGRLRHPAFVRMREDKTPAECLANQDEALAEYWKKATAEHSMPLFRE